MASSVASTVVLSSEFRDYITNDLMIYPIKLNCGNVFDSLPLQRRLGKMYRNKCPFCGEKITEAIVDKDLARRIQSEFVKISEANRDYFDQLKASQEVEYAADETIIIDGTLAAGPLMMRQEWL